MKTQHPNLVEFEVTGDYALFSDPIMRLGGEKCTYQVPTYEALKGILSSVYWKPTLIWRILDVRVMNPIQTEVKGIRPIKYGGGNDLAYYTYLKNCRYQVRACFDWMYHGITYPDEAYSEETKGRMTARFWYPVMKNGVIHFLPPEACPGQKPLRDMPMKSFSLSLENFTGLKEFGEVE